MPDVKDVLYVGSLWYMDCDPFATVFAETFDIAQGQLDWLVEEEEKQNLDRLIDDEIMTGGVHSFNHNQFTFTEEQLAEIEKEGYCII